MLPYGSLCIQKYKGIKAEKKKQENINIDNWNHLNTLS